MKVVYEAANLIDAHLVRHALEAVEIPVFLRGEALLGGMGELPLFGVVAVCVPDSAWPEADAVVRSLPLAQSGTGEVADDGAAEGDAADAADPGLAGWTPSPA